MSNPKSIYNEFIRANLPSGMTYDSDTSRYVVNDTPWVTYVSAFWYLRYIEKFGFSPNPIASLFANNEPGVWYDPSDLTTLFQDTAGTTPVTTPGQTVALMLDKSGNGFHATQPTTSRRPTYGIVPAGGRRNLLGFSEQIGNVIWDRINVSVATDSSIAPNGTTTADTLGDTGTSGSHSIGQVVTLAPGLTTISQYVKQRAGSRYFQLRPIGLGTGKAYANFDPVAGTVVAGGTGGTEFVSASMIDVGDGWYRCILVGNYAVAPTGGMAVVSNGTGEYPSYTGDGSGFFVWGAQLEVGSTATAYQKVTTQFDVTDAGVASLGYLSFDGVDDWMTAGTSADWNYLHDGTGSMAAFAVKTAEVANPNDISFVYSTNAGDPTLRGSYVAVDDRSSVSRNDAWNIRVSNTTTTPTPVFEVTNNTVSDIDGNCVFVFHHGTAETPDYTFRENGVVVYSGSYGEAPVSGSSSTALIIGAGDSAGANPLQGKLFSGIIRGVSSTTAEISSTEAYLAGKSGVDL